MGKVAEGNYVLLLKNQVCIWFFAVVGVACAKTPTTAKLGVKTSESSELFRKFGTLLHVLAFVLLHSYLKTTSKHLKRTFIAKKRSSLA